MLVVLSKGSSEICVIDFSFRVPFFESHKETPVVPADCSLIVHVDGGSIFSCDLQQY